MIFRLSIVLIAVLLASPALAADLRRIAAAGAWESYVYTERGSKVCYAAARAATVRGGHRGRPGLALTVTHRARNHNQVTVTGSDDFRRKGVEIQVGGMKHTLIASGESAWAKNPAADRAIIAAMTRHREATIHATPARSRDTLVDTVPLRGFAEALAAIDRACGVRR